MTIANATASRTTRTSVRTVKLNMFTLIAMGTGGCLGVQRFATIAPDIFPAAFRMDGAVDV